MTSDEIMTLLKAKSSLDKARAQLGALRRLAQLVVNEHDERCGYSFTPAGSHDSKECCTEAPHCLTCALGRYLRGETK